MAAARVPIGAYLVGTLIGLAPRTAVAVRAGSHLSTLDFGRRDAFGSAAVTIVVSMVVFGILGWFARRALDAAPRRAGSQTPTGTVQPRPDRRRAPSRRSPPAWRPLDVTCATAGEHAGAAIQLYDRHTTVPFDCRHQYAYGHDACVADCPTRHPTSGFVYQRVHTREDAPAPEAGTVDVAVLDMNHGWPNLGHAAVVRSLRQVVCDLRGTLADADLRVRVSSYDVRRGSGPPAVADR